MLASGELVTTDAERHPDLFWALRGGGGNFGIVTSFLFRLHPVSTIVGGPVFWGLDQAADVLRWYRDFIVEAPRELNGWFAFVTVPPVPVFPEHLHGRKMAAIIWCWSGRWRTPRRRSPRSRRSATRRFTGSRRCRCPALQGMFDPLYPAGLQWQWRADFLTEISDEAIVEHVRFGRPVADGAVDDAPLPDDRSVQDVGRNDTAFSYRDVNWAMVIAASTRTRRTRRRCATGRRTTGRRSTPTRPAAPT